ncbi:MAG: hypothetical protein U0746_06245 [Gemmataceae bacterium]
MLRILSVGLLVGGLLGCEAAKKEAKKVGETSGKMVDSVKETGGKVVEATKEKIAEMKEAFKKKFEGPLADFGKKFDELKVKASKATGDEKAKLEEKVKSVEPLMTQAKEQMAKIGDIASDKWDEWKKTFEELMEKIKKAFE